MKNETALEFIEIIFRQLVAPHDAQEEHVSHRKRKLRNEILKYYAFNPTVDSSILDALCYLKKKKFIAAFPYNFRDKYKVTKVHMDLSSDDFPYYTYEDGKRLFFHSRSMRKARKLMNSLLIEQDADSPHKYFSDFVQINDGDVMADVGCAEAFLSLKYIEKLSHLYLFECEDCWINALEKTFAPWRDKVTIVKKYVSDTDSENTIRLDSYFNEQSVVPNFIKLDIEGAEVSALQGMGNLLDKNLKLCVCTYHCENDYLNVMNILKKYHFETETSENYMLAPRDGFKPPYFRHGLVRAKKIN